MERQPVILTDPIRESQIAQVTRHLNADEFSRLFTELSIEHNEIENVQKKYTDTTGIRDTDLLAAQVLCRVWKIRFGHDATPQAILDALERCDNIEIKEKLEDFWNGIEVQKTPMTDFFAVIDPLLSEALPRLYEALGLTAVEIESAEGKVESKDKHLKARSVVRKWKRKNGKKATVEVLKEAAQQCRNRQIDDSLKFEDLQFQEEIGRGGFAAVHAATFTFGYYRDPISLRTFTEVAVKVLNRQEEEEVQILKNLRHPHIVSFLAYLNNVPSYYIVMERCKQSLFTYLQDLRKPLEEELKEKWVQEVLKAVNYLHENHVVHRDLRSKNCLLTEDEILKIADFGISKVTGETGDTPNRYGTLPFIAPEVVDVGKFSMASDIFALGFLFWEIYTREIPSPDKSEDPEQYIEERHKIPEHMQDLMRACWQRDYKKRPKFQVFLTQLTSDGLQAFTVQSKLQAQSQDGCDDLEDMQ